MSKNLPPEETTSQETVTHTDQLKDTVTTDTEAFGTFNTSGTQQQIPRNKADQVSSEEAEKMSQGTSEQQWDERAQTRESGIQPQSNNPSSFKKKNRAGLFVLIVLCVLFLFFSVKKTTLFSDNNLLSPHVAISTAPHIAVLHIEGVIEELNDTYDQVWLINTIRSLKESSQNKGILLYIDSPGGGVYESDEVYLELMDYKTSGKPVWAYLGPMAASGGYYIASAADHITANRNTLTGSIGVIAGESVDLSELMEKYGIRITTFTAGANKNMLNINSPVTPEHAQIMQSIADEAYEQFVGIVAESRNKTTEEIKELADGRIYTAQQALKNGLIDSIHTFDQCMYEITAYIEDDTVEFINYYPQQDLWDFSLIDFLDITKMLTGFSNQNSPLMEQIQKHTLPDISYPAYYYKAR